MTQRKDKKIKSIESESSLVKVTQEDRLTKREANSILRQNFGETIKAEYPNIYRIYREGFSYYDESRSSVLELLAEFDNVSGELVKFSGWLEGGKKDEDSDYIELDLIPLKTRDGVIYHFRGNLEQVSVIEGTEIRCGIPLSVVPVYSIPTGRIVELKPRRIGRSEIFRCAKVEYRCLNMRLEEE